MSASTSSSSSSSSVSVSASSAGSRVAATEGGGGVEEGEEDDRVRELQSIQANFAREGVALKDGREVRVRPMVPGDVRALTDVMSSAFRNTPDERPRARVAKYLLDQLEPNPEEVCLVALLPDDDDDDADSEDPKAEGGQPIAIVSLSFTQEARGEGSGSSSRSNSGAESLPPPPDAAYLCNMAVAEAHRGRGVAKALLRACDDLVIAMGGADLWLHVRVKDATALGLYQNAGYEVRGNGP